MRQLSRVLSLGVVGLLAFGNASIALAAPGKEGTKQATTPTSSASGTGSTTTSDDSDPNQSSTRQLAQQQGANADIIGSQRVQQKPWEIGGGFETHHLIIQDDLGGSAKYKQFNVLGLYGQYDFSQYDRVRVRAFIYEYFLADQGESGFRADDIVVSYTRRTPLAHQFTLRSSLTLTIPTSYTSQIASNVTSPSIGLNLEKKIGRYISVDGHGTGTWFFDKYAEGENGALANVKAALSFGLGGEVTAPFHEPLSLGMDVGTGYAWRYQPNTTGDTNPSVVANGTTADPQFSSQPVTQTYFGEVYLRYIMPTLFGVRSDVLVAFADGDPTVGSVSVLHDGVGHFYGFYRYSSEVYAALSAAY